MTGQSLTLPTTLKLPTISLSRCLPSAEEAQRRTPQGGALAEDLSALREMPTEPGQRGPVRCLRREWEDLTTEGKEEALEREAQGPQPQEAAEAAAGRRIQGEEGEGPTTGQGDARTGDRRPGP